MITEKNVRRLPAVLTAGLLLGLTAACLLIPGKQFSENENRYLATFPGLTWAAVKDGSFTEGLNSYLADHFPARDFFMGLKTGSEILAGKQEIGDVYLATDGSLIESYAQPARTEKIGTILNKFGTNLENLGLTPDLMLVPTAICVYGDRLPTYGKAAETGDQLQTMRQLFELAGTGFQRIEVSGELLNRREDPERLYYATDHHWTTYGAYIGYVTYCRQKGMEPLPLEAFDGEQVTDDFRGTIYSKVNDYSRKGDPITIYRNPADQLRVDYTDTKQVTDSLYNLEYVKKKDKYSLFLDNLHSLIEITNNTASSDRELVLVKDSYANSMVPFLAHHYKKIYVFDTRSYKLGPSVFIKEHPEITDVLVLYNLNTIDSDLGIGGIY